MYGKVRSRAVEQTILSVQEHRQDCLYPTRKAAARGLRTAACRTSNLQNRGYQINRKLYCNSRPELVRSWAVMRPKSPLLTSVTGFCPMKLLLRL